MGGGGVADVGESTAAPSGRRGSSGTTIWAASSQRSTPSDPTQLTRREAASFPSTTTPRLVRDGWRMIPFVHLLEGIR
jgi:hypothetical protein